MDADSEMDREAVLPNDTVELADTADENVAKDKDFVCVLLRVGGEPTIRAHFAQRGAVGVNDQIRDDPSPPPPTVASAVTVAVAADVALPITVGTDSKAVVAAMGNVVDGDVAGPQHDVLPVTVPAVVPHWATREVLSAVVEHAVTVVRLWAVVTDPPVHPEPVEAKKAAVL